MRAAGFVGVGALAAPTQNCTVSEHRHARMGCL